MSDEGRDLFGKIDALFEKRASDALVDKGLEHEDFPVLTEVIGQAGGDEVDWEGLERRVSDRRQAARRAGDRQGGEARPEMPALAGWPGEEVEKLMSAVEQRVSDLFIRQQLSLEEAIRQVVRDELDKRRPL